MGFGGGRGWEGDVDIAFYRELVAFVGSSVFPGHPATLDLFFNNQMFLSSNSHRLTLTQTSRTGMHLSQALQGTSNRLRSTPAWWVSGTLPGREGLWAAIPGPPASGRTISLSPFSRLPRPSQCPGPSCAPCLPALQILLTFRAQHYPYSSLSAYSLWVNMWLDPALLYTLEILYTLEQNKRFLIKGRWLWESHVVDLRKLVA